MIEDACQTAWTILCAHPDVAVHEHTTLGWLITTATREAWKHSRHLAERETPAGAFQPPGDNADHELAEPVGSAPDPCAVVVARDEASRRLAILTDRERVYLARVPGELLGEADQPGMKLVSSRSEQDRTGKL